MTHNSPREQDASAANKMIDRRSWEEFQNAGLIWWVNRFIHLFGWAIVVETDSESGAVVAVWPARCKFRGFDEPTETEGFEKLTAHIAKRRDAMLEDLEITSDENPNP